MDEEFFDELFGTLHTDCGFTPDEVRAMTLDDVARLFRFWRKHPPLRVLFWIAYGFKPRDETPGPSKYFTADDARGFLAMTGGKMPGVGRR